MSYHPIELPRSWSPALGRAALPGDSSDAATPTELPKCTHCELPLSARAVHTLLVEAINEAGVIQRVEIFSLHEQCAIDDLRDAVFALRRKFKGRPAIVVKAFISLKGFQ